MRKTLLTLSLLTTVAITHAADHTAINMPQDSSDTQNVSIARRLFARTTGAAIGTTSTFAAAVTADVAGYEALALTLTTYAGLGVGAAAGFVLIGDRMLPADYRITTYLYHMMQNGYSKLRFVGNDEEGKALLEADTDLSAEELTDAINSYIAAVTAENEQNLVSEAYILGMIEMNPDMDANEMYESLDPIEQELITSPEVMEAIYAVVGNEKARMSISKLDRAKRKTLKEKISKARSDTPAGKSARKTVRENKKDQHVAAVKNKVRAQRQR